MISGPNQKRAMRLFEFLGHFYAYFWRITSKMGGKWGHMVFLALTFLTLCGNFKHEKISDCENSFSCESLLT